MRSRALSFIAILAGAIAAAGPTCAADVVHIGITGAVSDVTLVLADKKGYFREAGITADFLTFDSGAKMVAPLGAGQLEVGAGATSAGLYNAVNRGINIKIAADKATNTEEYSYKALLVRKALIDSGKFKSLADLKGLKVAVSAPGAADNSVVAEAVKAGGLTLADIDRVYLGFAQQVMALANGGIDAAFGAEPNITEAVRQGAAVRFAGNSAFYPIQTSAVILYGGDFVEKHRDTAMRFMTAYLRAVRDYDNTLKNGKIAGPGSDLIIEILTEITKAPDPSLFRDMVASWCDPDGKPNMASLKKDLDYFKEKDGVSAAITIEQVVDTSFVDAALKELGSYKPGKS